jgi:hypothetical protein
MEKNKKNKLCWNCEGRVAMDAENCSYCAVYVGPALNSEEEVQDHEIAPPYKFIEAQENTLLEEAKIAIHHAPQENSSSEGSKQFVLPLAFLVTGSVFCLFGLVLFLYSEQNFFTLSWKSKYWFVYVLLSLPLLVLGFNALNKLDNE